MKPTPKTALTGAFIGSVAVAGALGLLVLLGQIPKAPFVAAWQGMVGGGWVAAAVLGGAAFIAIGTLWGLLMTFVPNPTIVKGLLVGIVPTIWALVVWPAIQGNPILADGAPKGILIPVVMNVVIWGSILGWYADRHTPDHAVAS